MADRFPDLTRHPLTAWNGRLGLPDFSQIDVSDFEALLDGALAAHAAEVEAIATNPAPPTIENTLAALELSGQALDRVSAVFWLLAGAHTDPVIQAAELKVAPKMARHFSAISMNADLFARIDQLHEAREALQLDPETRRVLERTWKRYVRSGAKLPEPDKARLGAINEELAGLGTRFSQNVLADESGWVLFLTEDDLAGVPDFLRAAMAQAAQSRGRPDAFAVTLSRSIYEPFTSFSERRDLREKAVKAFAARGQNGGDADNGPVVAAMLALRAEKAKLLGYETYAALKLEDTMAKTPEAVSALLQPVWRKALQKASEDQDALQALAGRDGINEPIEAWDWRFYAEKLRAQRFDFDEASLKPYLELDRVIAASFDVAGRLFGLRFEEQQGVAAWHPDVRVFRVLDRDGSVRGTFLADYFNRPSKRSGAWMSGLESAYRLGEGAKPIIYNVMNFAKPPVGEPALLSLDEARTLFHEFGHALHGLLSDVTWPSISGTSVARDFVELPSQLYEHWLTVPEILQTHARHWESGEPMPAALMDKVKAAGAFDAGFRTVEFTASALMDMAYHAQGEAPADPLGFEAETLRQLGMPSAILMRHRTPHFTHVFAGDGYSAGYYSYLWSEVLDADAFDAFEETGDPFDPALAERLRRFIYSAGGTEDPEVLYTAFRGRMPSPEPMMARRGLG